MLLDYYNRTRLPETDLVYLAFRIALERTVVDMDFYRDAGEEPEKALTICEIDRTLQSQKTKCRLSKRHFRNETLS